jgi:L-malate glycosyltransferase
LNILIVVSSLSFGGAEKQVIEDANLLCQANSVYVLTFREGPMGKLLDPTVNLVLIPRKDYFTTTFKVASILRRYSIDVVHAHLFAPMVLSAFAGKLTGIPVIWNFHSHAFENSLKAKTLHKYASRLSSVKRILFPALELDSYYQSEGYGFSREKCMLAYNSGQDNGSWQLKNRQNKPEPIHIGFIGRIIPLKRIHLLAELAQFLIDNGVQKFMIDIVGDGPELENLVQTVKVKNLESYVTFHGFQQDTLKYYRLFDIFAFSSGEEVLSLSLIDAGLSGIPAVAFDVGGNHEIITDGVTGYLVDTNITFFQKILTLINDDSLMQKLGSAARSECLSKFSPRARYDFLSSLYAQVR